MFIPPWQPGALPPPLIPPSLPSPPPPGGGGQLGGSGTADDPAIVVVIGLRPPPAPPAYGPGAWPSGAHSNFARDLAFAMMSPADRARALGMEADASITHDDGSDPFASDDPEAFSNTLNLYGDVPEPIRRMIEEALAEELMNSSDLAQIQINRSVGIKGEQIATQALIGYGYEVVATQVRVWIPMPDGVLRLRVYDAVTMSSDGQLNFWEFKTNGGVRTPRQLEADEQLRVRGGVLATSKLAALGSPSGTAVSPTGVGVVTVTVNW